MTAQQSVHIEAPVDKVFDFFKDPANWQGLQQGIVYKDIHVTQEGMGTNYIWVAKVAGLPVEGFGVFTEFVPNQRITDRSSRSFEGTWTYRFEPDGSGTRLTLENQPRSFWRFPPLAGLMAWGTAKVHDRVMSELKAAMEA